MTLSIGCGSCVLAFSGGRDSTIAAVRLSRQFRQLTLLTVVGEHLTGIENVYKRIEELEQVLACDAKWILVKQPKCCFTQGLNTRTCLPCQCAYIATIIKYAKQNHIISIATGYAGYQSDFEEQTPLAIAELKGLTEGLGVKLLLPVYTVYSKYYIFEELNKYHLSTLSLEQKCNRQRNNMKINSVELENQIQEWGKCISKTHDLLQGDNLSIIDQYDLEKGPKNERVCYLI